MSEPIQAKRRQKRMGPAPFASFEDLSDELESPEDRNNTSGSVVRLPGIREDPIITPSTTPIDKPDFTCTGISLIGAAVNSKMNLQPPNTPRIDISRASSSSHHNSKDSSPDRELFDSHDTGAAKLGLGFREEGTLDLRSSTEELDFQDQTDKKARKDSQCSEVALLCISGRTSRLSSIGSVGSGQSRNLSVVSGQSGLSRSPSPHKMLLETSFCGPKPSVETAEQPGTKIEVLEKVLLARKSDPTSAVLAEGISVEPVKSDIKITIDEPVSNKIKKTVKNGVEYIYIPLKGPLPLDESEPQKQKVRQVKSATIQSNCQKVTVPTTKSATPSPLFHKKETNPKYIRIRLKPAYMYSDDDGTDSTILPQEDEEEGQKPEIVQLQESNCVSPKPSRHTSKTPSPSLSRKSSFCLLFRSKETVTSPESPTVPSGRRKSTLSNILRDASENLRERARSKSRERDKSTAPSSTESIDSKSKHKSVFSIFKSKKPETELPIAKLEFKLNEKPLDGTSIRIPLHSPTHYENQSILQDLKETSQDSQETVIETTCRNVEAVVEVLPQNSTILNYRQSSTSSDNVVFSTQLGSTNGIFTTKLPKEKQINGETSEFTLEAKRREDDKIEAREAVTKTDDAKITAEDKDATRKTKHREGRSRTRQTAARTDNRERKRETREVITNTEDKGVKEEPKEFTTKIDDKDENIKAREATTNTEDREVRLSIKEVATKTEVKGVKKEPEVIIRTKDVEVKTEAKGLNRDVTTGTEDEKIIQSEAEYDATTKIEDSETTTRTEDDSSESDREMEIDVAKVKRDMDLKLEPERKGLVLQDSYEDELPYVPTTLPLERSAAVPIVPIKQRSTYEMKTCPIERPRSTTPINPSCLEEYCEEVMGNINMENVTKTIEKLKISLPRNDSIDKPMKSPRKTSGNWQEFAEKGITSTRRTSLTQDDASKSVQKEWINFEEIPERRRLPKRIQTLPSRGHVEDSVSQDVVYNYVNPEECRCECHELTAREREKRQQEEDELPLLEDETGEAEDGKILVMERMRLENVAQHRSVISNTSLDLSGNVEVTEMNGIDATLRTPFTSDLGLSSSRSSVISQDELQSPNFESPNAFPKTS